MFNGTLWAGIGVTAAAFLLILLIRYIVGDQGDWAPLLYAVPVMAGLLAYLVIASSKKNKPNGRQ